MINLNRLTLQRGHNLIIDTLDLTVDQGSALVIHGPNGSGKTTLLRAVSGLLAPKDGQITINGYNLEDDRINALRSMIYIGHRDGFSGHLTPRENLAIWAAGRGDGITIIDAAIPEALTRLGIDALSDTPLFKMSEGQRKRCGLVRLSLALALKDNTAFPAPVWVLDEPLTALDQDMMNTVTSLIEEHTQEGGSVMLSSHHQITLQSASRLHLDQSGGLS